MIDPLVIYGRLVTFGEDRGVIDDGALYIGADERIAAVADRSDPAPAGFESARHLETRDVVYPGLIDLHNHIAYNALPLWASPTRETPWEKRSEWPDDPAYRPDISLPANALAQVAGEALLKYVETKAVVGGVTAIQGSAKVPNYNGWLVRNVEKETFRTKKTSVRQSVRELEKPADFARYRKAMDEGLAFIYHLSEGSHEDLIAEFEALRDNGCLHPRLIAVHATALGPDQYAEWGAHGGSIVWSPFSNLWLYGQTTRVAEARDAGLRICLGADWSPSGTKNLLGELKVADLYNRESLDRAFTAEDLVRMVTANPADALGWGDRLGRLREGLHGDVLVTTAREPDPYRNLVSATERDVLFVAINGYPFYGTNSLMRAAGATHAEPIQVGRLRRRIVLVYPGYPDADLSWSQVKEELASARADPKRHEQSRGGARPQGEVVRVEPEKPWDEEARRDLDLDNVPIPQPDPLTHNSAYFRAIERQGFHAGALDGLEAYFSGGPSR